MEIEDEIEDIAQTSNKIKSNLNKEGLREGISAGRDTNFQESFDKGFSEGFKNGFLLGQFRGILMAESKQTSTEEKVHPLLKNIKSGSCEICKNTNSTKEEDNINELLEIQNKIYEINTQTLKKFTMNKQV